MGKNNIDGCSKLESQIIDIENSWMNLSSIKRSQDMFEWGDLKDVSARTIRLIIEDILEKDKYMHYEKAEEYATILFLVLFNLIPTSFKLKDLLDCEIYRDIHPRIQGLLKTIEFLIEQES
jgi:hypothetical protein